MEPASFSEAEPSQTLLEVDLRGKRAIVTGGGRGIGRAISLALARNGADLAILYRSDASAAEATAREARSLGRRVATFAADVSDGAAVEQVIGCAVAALGGVEILVNNAGTITRKPLLDLSDDEWREVIATNLDGTFFVSRAVGRAMVRAQTPGVIVNVTSVHQTMLGAGVGHYVVSKAGQWALTRQLAYELAPYSIRVNAVAPGPTLSDINRELFQDAEYRARRTQDVPLGMLCEPDDHANAVLYLVSAAARMVTGECISPAGGVPLVGPRPIGPDESGAA